MNTLKRILKVIGVTLLAIISIPLLFMAVSFTVHQLFYKNFGQSAVDINNVPEKFPVLVMTQENGVWNAETLYYKDLPAYTAENPSYTFLVPKEDLKRLEGEVRPANPEEGVVETSFKVVKDSGATQTIEVEYMFDEDYTNIGWYEAAGKDVRPQKYQLSFLGGGMQSMMIAFPTTIVLWIVGLVTILVLRKRKNLPV